MARGYPARAVGYLERIYRASEDENRRDILRAMPPRPGARLLDLGCGNGEFTAEVGRHIGAGELCGIEFVEEFAERAREQGVDAVSADLGARLPHDDASFDVIHSNQVIEHLPRTDSFLKEIRRLLRPGGYAVVSTNNLASWHNIVFLTLGWQPSPAHVSDEAIVGNPMMVYDEVQVEHPGQTHMRVFTGRALAELAAFHGLKPEAQLASGYYPLPPRVARLFARLDPRHGAFLIQRYSPA